MIRPLLSSLVLAGCAALGGAAELIPDGPVYASADLRPFWYATILDWNFTGDAYSHNSLPSHILPKRLVEVALWRGQVTDTPNGPRWSGENWLTWKRVDGIPSLLPGTLGVQMERARGFLTTITALDTTPCSPGCGDILLDLTSGSPVDSPFQESDDFSVFLLKMGLPDLALGQRAGPGITRQVLPGKTPGWTWDEPQMTKRLGMNLGQMDLGGLKLNVTLKGETAGTANGRLAWDAATGRPLSSTVVAKVSLALAPTLAKPLPKDIPTPEIRGQLVIRRQGWVLPDSTGLEVPRDLPKLLTALAAQAVVDGKPTSWADLARSPDADLANVAAGVVLAAAHPPEFKANRAP
jgi:hypothetical protein